MGGGGGIKNKKVVIGEKGCGLGSAACVIDAPDALVLRASDAAREDAQDMFKKDDKTPEGRVA